MEHLLLNLDTLCNSQQEMVIRNQQPVHSWTYVSCGLIESVNLTQECRPPYTLTRDNITHEENTVKIPNLFAVTALILTVQLTPANASPINLPEYSIAGYQYGDFYSYSLALLNLSVQSSGGLIKQLPVLATGSSAANNTPQGMDDAYLTSPSVLHGQSSLSSTFSTAENQGDGLAEGKNLTNSWANTWDINLSVLKNFLGGNDMVVLFDNNQSQNANSPILKTYGQIVIRGSENSNLDPYVFDFVNVNYNNGTVGGLGAFDYDSVGMKFQTIENIPNYVPVPNTIIGTNVASNVGNNEADFAIFSPEIQELLNDPTALAGYTTMSFFVDFGNRTAGNEQIFLATADVTASTPEPGTILLMGVGALGVAFMGRRMRKH